MTDREGRQQIPHLGVDIHMWPEVPVELKGVSTGSHFMRLGTERVAVDVFFHDLEQLERLRDEISTYLETLANKNQETEQDRQEAELARFREALEEIAEPFDESSLREGPEIARRALGPREEENDV